jgi:hypothetical protein
MSHLELELFMLPDGLECAIMATEAAPNEMAFRARFRQVLVLVFDKDITGAV